MTAWIVDSVYAWGSGDSPFPASTSSAVIGHHTAPSFVSSSGYRLAICVLWTTFADLDVLMLSHLSKVKGARDRHIPSVRPHSHLVLRLPPSTRHCALTTSAMADTIASNGVKPGVGIRLARTDDVARLHTIIQEGVRFYAPFLW